MSENVQIKAEFRFNDGDGSKPYKWKPIPVDKAGTVEDGTYETDCVKSQAQKAVVFETIVLPTTLEDLEEIPEEVQIELTREAIRSRKLISLGKDLRKKYESPQQRENREKKESASRKEYLGDKMEAFSDANPGEMPDAALFMTWKAEAEEHSKK